MSYKSVLYVLLEFALENELSSKKRECKSNLFFQKTNLCWVEKSLKWASGRWWSFSLVRASRYSAPGLAISFLNWNFSLCDGSITCFSLLTMGMPLARVLSASILARFGPFWIWSNRPVEGWDEWVGFEGAILRFTPGSALEGRGTLSAFRSRAASSASLRWN